MPLWKALLLGLYYHASLPARCWQGRRAAAGHRAALMVLYYHRVADDRATPWTVARGLFDRQIRWLKRHFELISLEETGRRIRTTQSDRPAVSITFDDGYGANCLHAIPMLIREQIPCTYFVSLGHVLDGRPFEHDMAYGRYCPPNSLEQLRTMAAAGIEIGAHTYSHADLGRITDPQRLEFELVAAKADLEAALGRRVRYFAFPYGQHVNLSRQALELAGRAGYEAVCSAYGGYNFPGDDAFHLQRIPVDNTMIRLKNWTTVDPRKRNIPRFDGRRTTDDGGRRTGDGRSTTGGCRNKGES
ncbi:MAG: polysaccharide deacetylase family protein [Thermoguttaceae bacterium]|jgi:peptidoglycan/xylan/chitin deacetylase (PgdA/CDA1 family)